MSALRASNTIQEALQLAFNALWIWLRSGQILLGLGWPGCTMQDEISLADCRPGRYGSRRSAGVQQCIIVSEYVPDLVGNTAECRAGDRMTDHDAGTGFSSTELWGSVNLSGLYGAFR